MRIISLSEKKTKQFAGEFAYMVLNQVNGEKKGAVVIALSGELGAGKTTFAQGFARGLGIRKRIVSPTFVFARRYALRSTRFQHFFHIDAYRVRSASWRKNDLKGLELDEVFANSRHLVLVEWAENVRALLPKGAIWVKMKHGEHENHRVISISN